MISASTKAGARGLLMVGIGRIRSTAADIPDLSSIQPLRQPTWVIRRFSRPPKPVAVVRWVTRSSDRPARTAWQDIVHLAFELLWLLMA